MDELFQVFRKGREKSGAAQVVSRRVHTSRSVYCKTCMVQPDEIVTTHFITFRLDSGEEPELEVPGEVYAGLKDGQRGILSFQGRRFLGFEQK